MAELLTRLDFYQTGRRYLLTRAQRIEPGVVDTEGSDANLFVGSTSYCAHATSLQLADRVGALLLDGAFGEDLDRYAFDHYQQVRKGAAAAVAPVVFTRPTAAAGAGTIPAGTKLATLTGIEYVLTTAATFGAAQLVASADVRAVQAGREYQVGRNSITRFVQRSSIFDQTIQPNNEEPTAGGEPTESDDAFKSRIRDFWNAARRGTLGAIAYGARTVPGVASSTVIEVTDAGIPSRIVEVFVADSSGVANTTLARQVSVVLDEWRAGGVYALVKTSSPQIVSVRLLLSFRAGVDTVTLSGNVKDAVVAFINDLGVNQPLFRADLQGVLSRFRSSGLIPVESGIVVPAGDLYPDVGRTLRTLPVNVEVL